MNYFRYFQIAKIHFFSIMTIFFTNFYYFFEFSKIFSIIYLAFIMGFSRCLSDTYNPLHRSILNLNKIYPTCIYTHFTTVCDWTTPIDEPSSDIIDADIFALNIHNSDLPISCRKLIVVFAYFLDSDGIFWNKEGH